MKFWLSLSIRNKIILLTFLISTLSVTIVSVLFAFLEIHQIRTSIVSSSGVDARLVAENCIVSLDFGYNDRVEQYLQKLQVNPSITQAVVFDNEGEMFAEYNRNKIDESIPKLIKTRNNYFEKDILHIFEPVKFENQIYGYVYLRVDSKITELINNRIRLITLIYLAIVLFSLILASSLQRLITRPIIKLAQTAKIISTEHNFNIQLPKKSFDEIGMLYDEFNEMISIIRNREEQRDAAELELIQLNGMLESKISERTARLEAANKELTELAYISAHDLKTPLRGIGQLATWLKLDYTSKLDSTAVEQIELLIGRVKRMDSLVDAMLLYTGLNREKLKKQQVDLTSVLNLVIQRIKPDAFSEIVVESILPMVFVDKELITLLLTNLISNALKYNNKERKKVILTAFDNAEFWFFSISDNGNGIPEKYHDQIFKIFKTLTSDYKDETTGIGLPVAKKITELHGGQLTLTSVPGRGSSFTFSIHKT